MNRSFRDPDGFVFGCGSRIFRCVLPSASDSIGDFLSSPLYDQLLRRGQVCRSWILDEEQGAGIRCDLPRKCTLLEHQPITFSNYPCEWAPEMLLAAARLTLDVASQAVDAGFALKDAKPQNVMFESARPVFLDLLSFERPDQAERIWRPYAQFVRTFLYPLMLWRYVGLRMDEILPVNPEGPGPGRMRR